MSRIDGSCWFEFWRAGVLVPFIIALALVVGGLWFFVANFTGFLVARLVFACHLRLASAKRFCRICMEYDVLGLVTLAGALLYLLYNTDISVVRVISGAEISPEQQPPKVSSCLVGSSARQRHEIFDSSRTTGRLIFQHKVSYVFSGTIWKP